MTVTLIAQTVLTGHYFDMDEVRLNPPADGSYVEQLCEFSGRACYQSFGKNNPATASTDDYLIKNILGKGHESVLEHASATFYVTNVSRALGYELLRHRHLSRSELSQRYVDMSDTTYVPPPLLRDSYGPDGWGDWGTDRALSDATAEEHFANNFGGERIEGDYEAICHDLEAAGRKYFNREVPRKEIREAARAVLPNATETRFTVTGNYRAWRHVIRMRGALDADREIAEFAIQVYRILANEAPALFADMELRVDEATGREYIGACSLTPAQTDGDRPVREWSVKHTGLVAGDGPALIGDDGSPEHEVAW